MKRSEVPEGAEMDHVEVIKRHVGLEDLIRDHYDDLWKELERQFGQRLMRLASPFRKPGDSSKSVVIFQNNESGKYEWHWADPLAPSQIPRDVIGFVMMFDGCEYEEAVERLRAILKDSQEFNRLYGFPDREAVAEPPYKELRLAEIQHTRARIATMGGLLPEEIDQLFASQTRRRSSSGS
jgi:hypothetical protein